MKDIPGYEGLYAATKDGRIYSYPKGTSSKKGRFLKLHLNGKNGYVYVGLFKDGKKICRRVHRLVASAFLGYYPEPLVVCHNNGVRNDNRLENLRWDTRESNEADKKKHGTDNYNKGEDKWISKLKEEDIKRIREKYTTEKYTQKNWLIYILFTSL